MGDKRKMSCRYNNCKWCGFISECKIVKENAELEQEKCELLGIIQGKDKTIKSKDKTIKNLKEKISVLLSCKNCPENKGGYICQKEYEDKCFAQKMQYIKELKEENADVKELLARWCPINLIQ